MKIPTPKKMSNSYAFLAKYYDEFISQDCDYVSWSQYLLSKACSHNVKTVVDVACGTGKMTKLLAGAGLAVTATDVSREMLNQAVGGCQATFVLQDMRRLKMLRAMDMAVCVNDGVNYLKGSELTAFFMRVADNLKCGAPFIFDISSEYKLTQTIGDNVFYRDCDDQTLLWTNKSGKNQVTMELTLFVKQGELYRRFDERHTQYIHSRTDVEAALSRAGFNVCEVTANYGQPLKSDSQRITFYTVKNT